MGHPVVEHLKSHVLDQAFIRTLRSAPNDRLVALMPGSRRQEVASILARQLVVAKALAARHPPCSFVLALASEAHRELAAPLVAASGLSIRTVVGKTHEAESAADLALTKSGTTTLELAFYETPMAVFYNVTWADWNLAGRWLVTTPFLSLPNALAGRPIVPEYMRAGVPDAAMIDDCSSLLVDDRRRAEVKSALADIHRRIDLTGTSLNAAREVLALVGATVPESPFLRWGFDM